MECLTNDRSWSQPDEPFYINLPAVSNCGFKSFWLRNGVIGILDVEKFGR